MLRKLIPLLLALLLPATALAEAWEGRTVALSTQTLRAERAGVVASLAAEAGQRVEAGDVLAELAPERFFAPQDGTVALISAEPGEEIDGDVLELEPAERYVVHCTVSKAYQSAETTLVHGGETLYVRCTADGSHRAVGVVAGIDGAEYTLLVLGGELYVGETVYLYRDAAFTMEQRVGIGTVVASDTVAVQGSGTLTRLAVAEGDLVERGQLLFELNGGTVAAEVAGIVNAVLVQPGDAVAADQAVAELVPEDQVGVELQVDEAGAAALSPGQAVLLTLPDDETLSATVLDTAWIAEDGAYTVRLLPDGGAALPLGMSVTARLP